MSLKSDVSFFVSYIFPMLIFGLGSVGNMLGIRVLLNKELNNIGPRDTYRFLFLTDQFYLLQIIGTYLQYAFKLNVGLINDQSCKLWNYVNYSFASVSPWLYEKHVYFRTKMVSICV